jgi:hypothetical protein
MVSDLRDNPESARGAQHGFGTVSAGVYKCSCKETGTAIKYAEALGEARQLISTIRKVNPGETAVIEKMIAKDHAVQFGGNICADIALTMLNAPSRNGVRNS